MESPMEATSEEISENAIQLPETRMRATQDQFACFIDYMERHGELMRPCPGPYARVKADLLWHQCAEMLNAVPGGVSKTAEKWRKVWADWKNNTKKKAMYLRCRSNIGSKTSLTCYEERLIELMKKQRDIRDTVPSEDAPSEGNKQHYEIIVHSDFAPIYSSVSPPEETNTSTQQDLVAVKSETIDNYDDFVEEITNEIPCEPSPSPIPSAEPPPKSRRRFRNQRTPYDRITSEYFALEHRRLKFEEERDRRLHEREMERLKLEAQRIEAQRTSNDVWKSLIPIAKTITEAFQNSFAKRMAKKIVRKSENCDD